MLHIGPTYEQDVEDGTLARSEVDDVTRSGALAQRLNLLARHEFLQNPLTTRLPLTMSVSEGHHRLARTSRFCRALGAVPRAASPGSHRARAVQLGIEGVRRIHNGPVPAAGGFTTTLGYLRRDASPLSLAIPPVDL